MRFIVRSPAAWRAGRAGAVLTLLVPLAAAQAPRVPHARPSLATLPESNEALLISDRVEEALSAGDYRLAVELVDQLMSLPGALVGAPASRTYYPIWRQAARLLDQFPPAALELYRRLYDAEVGQRFAEARAAGDTDGLRELFRRFRLTTEWRAIGLELTDQLLDQGRFAEAAQVATEILHTSRGDGGAALRMAVAVGALGDATAARRWLRAAETGTLPAEVKNWPARLSVLRDWLEAGEQAGSGARAGRPLRPRIDLPLTWSRPALLAQVPGGDLLAQELLDAGAATGRLSILEPAVAEGRLIVRLLGTIYAFDTLTLTPLWQSRETPGEGMPWPPDSEGWAGGGEAPAAGGVAALLSQHLRHTLRVGLGYVFSIEGLPAPRLSGRDLIQRPWRVETAEATRNELVARDLRSGAVAWRSGADPSGPLFDAAFQDRPLIVGDRILAAYARGGTLYLGLIDPRDGRLLREVEVIGPPTTFPNLGGACLLAADEATVYVSTGNGVVAAFEAAQLDWKWATVYPSTLAEQRGRLWWQPVEEPLQFPAERPLIARDLLIVAASDSPEILGLDRFDGRERWRAARGEYGFLVGSVEAGLVVGSHVLTCLDLDDPEHRPVVWRSVPLEICGRPLIYGGSIFVPTTGGLAVVDAQTGKLAALESPAAGVDGWSRPAAAGKAEPRDARAGDAAVSLALAADAIIGIGPSRLVRYPDPEATRRRCDELLARDPAEERAALGRAWLEALTGRYSDALGHLDAMTAPDERLAEARDQLYTLLFESLAATVGDPVERLTWLRRAVERARTPETAQRLAIQLGRRLEQVGDVENAARQYVELIVAPVRAELEDPGDPRRRAASWLFAVQRLRGVIGSLPPASAQRLMAEAIAAARTSANASVALERLRLAAADAALRARVEREIVLAESRPELAARFVETVVEAPQDELSRRLLLARWDTHASLGMLDEARSDRQRWQQLFGEAGGDRATPEERQRIEAIELAMRKIEQSTTPPFTERLARQWRLEKAELIVDLARPDSAARPWVLVRNLEEQQIELRRAATDGLRLRQTPDGLASRGGVGGPGPDSRERSFLARLGSSGAQRTAWPAVIHGDLAAVPVAGGLIGLGLGPERYAGRWRWEAALSGWEDIPTRVERICVAGSECVHVATRRDRIISLGWVDGSVWWQRELPGAGIERLWRSGDRLVAVTDDQTVWVMDAATGDGLERFSPEGGSVRAVEAVGGALLVWSGEAVARVDPHTLERVWVRPCQAAQERFLAPREGWVAQRAAGARTWQLLDAGSGEPVLPEGLTDVGEITAMTAEGGRLYVAGMTEDYAGDATRRGVRLTAIRLGDGKVLWTHEFRTRVAVNTTQLAGHPRFIPLLLDQQTDEEPASIPLDGPALQLVDKTDGTLLEPLSIRGDYRPQEAACDLYVLVTPARIVVQAAGNLIAYGNSSLGSAP